MAEMLSYEVKKIDGKGNSCVATRPIKTGERIFSERPQFYHIFNQTSNISDSISTSRPVLCEHCSLYFVQCCHRQRFNCNHCGYRYCSNECRQNCGVSQEEQNIISSYASSGGHRWLCHMDKKLVHDLNLHKETLYFPLALQTYAIIAEDAFQLLKHTKTQFQQYDTTASAIAEVIKKAASDALSGYHTADYCLSLHAFRTQGRVIDKEMFDTLIGPAYFESYLLQPLRLIRELLLSNFSTPAASTQKLLQQRNKSNFSSNNDTISSNTGDDISKQPEQQLQQRHDNESTIISEVVNNQDEEESRRSFMLEFVECDLLKEQFFRNMLGIFSTNNLTINISSNKMCSNCDFCSHENSIAPNNDNNLTSINSSSDCRTGTGLYPTYSKMNHSCECNTFNNSCNTEISVYASRDIQMGEEITTSYLHAANASTFTRRKRHKLLAQYLFECNCSLCVSEGVNDDDDEDDEDDEDSS